MVNWYNIVLETYYTLGSPITLWCTEFLQGCSKEYDGLPREVTEIHHQAQAIALFCCKPTDISPLRKDDHLILTHGGKFIIIFRRHCYNGVERPLKLWLKSKRNWYSPKSLTSSQLLWTVCTKAEKEMLAWYLQSNIFIVTASICSGKSSKSTYL